MKSPERRGERRFSVCLIPLFFIVLIIAVSPYLCAGANGFPPFSVTLLPELELPVGSSSDLLKPGMDVRLNGNIDLFKFPFLPGSIRTPLSTSFAYDVIPLQKESSLMLFSGSGGIAVEYEVFPRLLLGAAARVGAYYGILTTQSRTSGSGALVEFAVNPSLFFSPSFAVSLEGRIRKLFGLHTDIGVSVGVSYHYPKRDLPTKRREGAGINEGDHIEFLDSSIDGVFPVFYKYYDSHRIGQISLKNTSTKPIENLVVTFFVNEYMDNPKVCVTIEKIEPGETSDVDLFALFNNSLLTISEGELVSSFINVNYQVSNRKYRALHIENLTIFNRNAMTWDDDRKAASFVTAKDTQVMQFAKNIVGIVNCHPNKSVNNNFLIGMGIYTALGEYGLSYVIDPTTPYTEKSEDQTTVDFLQFPNQTLSFKAGDCDDMSILYAALLESVGVETAFITVPGHIYMAFSVGLEPEMARRTFYQNENLIFKHDKAWIPVEITLVGESFLKAWSEGAKQWRKYGGTGDAGFYPVHEAWSLYEPVGYPQGQASITLPPEETLENAYSDELDMFISAEIETQIAELEKKASDRKYKKKKMAILNRIGTIYARYGLMEKAGDQFKYVLKKKEYYPALVNLGNIEFMHDDMEKALNYYRRADKIKPDQPFILVNMAKANHELENYGNVRELYARVEKIDPALAEKYSYLGTMKGDLDKGRASDAKRIKKQMLWYDSSEEGD